MPVSLEGIVDASFLGPLPPPIYLDSRLATRVGVQRERERICLGRAGRGKRPEVVEGRSCRSDGVQGGRRM